MVRSKWLRRNSCAIIAAADEDGTRTAIEATLEFRPAPKPRVHRRRLALAILKANPTIAARFHYDPKMQSNTNADLIGGVNTNNEGLVEAGKVNVGSCSGTKRSCVQLDGGALKSARIQDSEAGGRTTTTSATTSSKASSPSLSPNSDDVQDDDDDEAVEVAKLVAKSNGALVAKNAKLVAANKELEAANKELEAELVAAQAAAAVNAAALLEANKEEIVAVLGKMKRRLVTAQAAAAVKAAALVEANKEFVRLLKEDSDERKAFLQGLIDDSQAFMLGLIDDIRRDYVVALGTHPVT